jgi:hypothetical protein
VPDRAPDLTDPATLLGAWSLARLIDDRQAGVESRVDGRLLLTEVEPGRIQWEESGQWHQPTGDVDVRRALWLERVEGESWWVRFEDGTDFHPWSPGEAVTHPCSPDTYVGLVDGAGDTWAIRWDVTGPSKDYTMTTELTR